MGNYKFGKMHTLTMLNHIRDVDMFSDTIQAKMLPFSLQRKWYQLVMTSNYSDIIKNKTNSVTMCYITVPGIVVYNDLISSNPS